MIICADDYGLSSAVNDGIIELIETKRISAVSCMMIGPDVDIAMNRLQALKKKCDVGLHLILTNDRPLTKLKFDSGLVNSQGLLLPFNHILKNTYKNFINFEALTKEISAQLNRFIKLMGYPPDYIDGHQHVQQLPVVRNAVVKVIEALMKDYQNVNVYVRIASLPQSWLMTKGVYYLRKFVVRNFMIALPGKQTARLLNQKNISHNRFLLGYYDYKTVRFSDIFRGYLTLKPDARDIFYCHPGYIDQKLRDRDSVVESRVDTLNFLKSNQYEDTMLQSGVILNKFHMNNLSGNN